ncbi:hypothetical protein F4775DRAFT_86175 [Biscogniauxia sp. FL1348]|nr:hypothetical protein F4775DRAFT_86175 [Biscogniauxia sp. FL1348]
MACRYQSNKYCVCTACIEEDGLCETLTELEKHLKTVASLLSKDMRLISIQFSRPGRPSGASVTCPAVLLAYFSGAIDRQLRADLQRGKRLDSINFVDEAAHGGDFKTLVEWCLTGRVELDGEPPRFSSGDRMERLWYLAKALDMPRFANFAMRLIMAKYSWNFLGHHPGTPVLDVKHAPYEPFGPDYIVAQPGTNGFPTLLFIFLKGLVLSREPCSAKVLAKVHRMRAYKRKWQHVYGSQGQLGLWIEDAHDGLVDESAYLPMLPQYSFRFFVDHVEREPGEWFNELRDCGFQDAAAAAYPGTACRRPLQTRRDLVWAYQKPYVDHDFYESGIELASSHDSDSSVSEYPLSESSADDS